MTLRSELPPGGGGDFDLAGEPGEVLREVRRTTGAADGVIGKARILEVDEIPFSVPVQLPPPSKPERGVGLLPPFDRRLEAELVVRPDPLRSEEHGEILQQLARSAVPGEAVEGVAGDHIAPEPVDEAGLGIEPLALPVQQIVEAPGAPGPVELSLPDGSVH